MKQLVALTVLLLVAFAIFMPTHNAQALSIWAGAKCGGAVIGLNDGPTGACNLCDAMIVLRNIINFGFTLAISISTGMIAWGAVRMMTAGGSESNVSEAKKIIFSAITGVAIALGSWIIVNTLFSVFTGSWNWNHFTC